MSEAGILSASVESYMYIYEMFVQFTADGVSVMDAYAEISRKCYTCEENVRKIIRRMQREI